MNYHPTLPDGDVFMGVAGVSHTRDALLELIRELDMRHPQNNLLRNAKFISRDGTTFELEYVSFTSLFTFVAYLFLHFLIFLV